MKRLFTFIAKNYLLLQASLLSLVAIVNINDAQKFWALITSSIVVFGLDEIVKELRKLNSK